MDFDPQDQDIIRLLTKLKDADAKYPEPMLVARRRSYLKRMTEIGLGIGVDLGVRNGKAPSTSVVPSTFVETALVVAIIAEASAAAYLYRDKLIDFIQTIIREPRVQEVVPSPVVTTSLEMQGLTPLPAITPTFPSVVLSASPAIIPVTGTATPVPGVAGDNNAGSPQVNSTSIPNGNNGNHYGQTPQPERTREPGGNNAQPPRDNGNQSPQDHNDQHPKDKPPKDK